MSIFDTLSQKMNELIPQFVQTKPAPQAGKVLESARKAGEEIRTRIGQPIAQAFQPPKVGGETLFQKIASGLSSLFQAPVTKPFGEFFTGVSKVAGGVSQAIREITEGKPILEAITPERKPLQQIIAEQPTISEELPKTAEKVPILGKIPGFPLAVGLIGEVLLPPYFGKAANFADDLAKITSKSATKNLLVKGVKDISEKEADTLASKLAPITDKKVIQTTLDTFAKSKAEIAKISPKIAPREAIGKEYLQGYRDYVAEMKKVNIKPTTFENWVKFKGIHDLRISQETIKIAPELEPLAQEARKIAARGGTAEEFVKINPIKESKVPQLVYNGSPNQFETFDIKFLGKQGRTEGSGFYFTDKKDIAQGYVREEGGKLFEVYLDIKKPMSLEQRKITSKQLNDVLEEVLKKDREALGNYGGDINSIGKENTKKIARDILETNETDVDLISDMINSGILPPQEINDIFRKVSGYDGIITKWPANPGEKQVNLFIALSPDQIKTKSQLTDFYNQAVKGNGFVEETIISRQGIGKTQLESPLKTYNKFAEQEATFRGDIMQDPALGIVGERVGDAFEQVIKLKQDIGATIGNEIKTIGKLKTSTALAQEQFGKNLVEQGLKLNKGILSQTKLSKLTGEDVKLLQRYISELNKLSENPTLAELDAFLSRLPKELEVYKSQNNIIKVTNGERLIKENLTQLRQSASPKINPKFENYFNAKSLYSDLTNFVDEGLRFLGKRT